jgi:integrase
MRRPFFRRDTMTWYVFVGSKQISLGKDERFKAPPATKPKEPPPAVQKRYLDIMQRQAEPEDRRLSFCIDEYLKSLEGCEADTVKRADYFLHIFQRSTGDVKISKLRSHHVDAALTGRDWKPNTVRDFMARIDACLNYCVRKDWIARNPLKGKLQLPAVERRQDIMSLADRERVMAEATGCFRDVLLFLSGTACRPIEARFARVEKCDLDKGILMVRNKSRKKTGAKERPVFLSSRMIEQCRELIDGRKEGWLLMNSKGGQWTQTALEHRIQKLCDKLGITHGATLYSFRHNWISEAINKKDMNPALVAIQAGHSDLKMLLKHYLHSDHEAMRKALDGAAE